MTNIAPRNSEVENLDKKTERLLALSIERPMTLVAVRYGYDNEFYVAVGFTNLETVKDETITLNNGMNEVSLRIQPDNSTPIYINKNHFLDYLHLGKKE